LKETEASTIAIGKKHGTGCISLVKAAVAGFKVVISKDVVVYILVSLRSARVLKDRLGENPKDILNVDRNLVYRLLFSEYLSIDCFWVQLSKDYVKIYDMRPVCARWEQVWINRIKKLFCLSNERLVDLADKEQFQIPLASLLVFDCILLSFCVIFFIEKVNSLEIV